MNNPNIRRYGQELKKAVRGSRLRKRLLAEFRRSLTPLLEEVPDPSYEDLVDAFGPPEYLAQSLLQTMEIPQPILLWKKLVLCVCAVLVLCAVGFGAFSLWNVPEEGAFLSIDDNCTVHMLENGIYSVSETFSYRNIDWDLPREMTAYLILLESTNSVPTNVFVYYSDRQPPHTFQVPAGETRVFVVNDPHPGPHSIAFNSPDGTLSGTVRVLLSGTPIS